MKFLHRLNYLWIALCIMITSAQASEIGFEPIAGYGFIGSLGVPNSFQDSFHSVALGARGFFQWNQFFLGPDVLYFPDIYYIPAGSTHTTSGTTNVKLGLTGGVQFPFHLRCWVGFNFLDEITHWEASPMQYSGFSWKLGAGSQLFPFLNLNLELIFSQYTTSEFKRAHLSIRQNLSGNSAPSGSVLLLSVSIPLSLSI